MIHGKRYRLLYTKDTGYNYNIRVKAYIITGTWQNIWSTQALPVLIYHYKITKTGNFNYCFRYERHRLITKKSIFMIHKYALKKCQFILMNWFFMTI